MPVGQSAIIIRAHREHSFQVNMTCSILCSDEKTGYKIYLFNKCVLCQCLKCRLIYCEVSYYPCIRNLARPGLAGAKAWPESRGESGPKPGSGRGGQGIKNPGKTRPQGQPSLARPRLTGALRSTLILEKDGQVLVETFNKEC